MQAGFNAVYDCIRAMSPERADRRFGPDSSKIVKGATLKIYPGAPHGLCSTLKDQVNADLLAFIRT